MSRKTPVFGVVAGLLALATSAGCARFADVGSPGAAARPVSSEPAVLAGVWEGQIWETPADYVQGVRRVTVNIADGGSWRATIGGAECATGVATLRDSVVILRSQAPVGVPCMPYSVELGRERMWAEFSTSFKGRTSTAAIDLLRVRARAQEAASASSPR